MADRLRAEGHEVAFVGTPDGLESRLAPETGVDFHPMRARGFDRGNPVTLLTSLAVILGSVLASRRLLRRLRPDVVIGFGGYVSLPVGLAAVSTGVPLVLHEQNSVPGLANKVLSRWAHAVGVTYEGSVARLAHPERATVTGNPVRAAVLGASRERGRTALGLADDAMVLLVFGGSRGARHLNTALATLAPALIAVPSLQVVHVAGRIEVAEVAQTIEGALGEHAGRYRVVDYIDRMGDAIAAADLVVSRAGATSIAEVTAIGRPSILVPYPYATDDHQTKNAAVLVAAGAARVIPDSDLDGPAFGETLFELLASAALREEMARAARGLAHRDATERVVELAREAAGI